VQKIPLKWLQSCKTRGWIRLSHPI